ncbi:GNAT family N-acetyltransferase [Psychrobacillus sp. L3]|uniref:GNAT family N-acetyltransferase n=1 Tax=Psychrobacillus sp. L3 TaxID=3236891 RepID=UPI0036F351A5
MDISIMTVSIPLDIETMEEINVLVQESFLQDKVNYMSILSVDELSDYYLKGFCVLAYEDETDKLVGVVSAVDRIATLDFEWSAVVLPNARRQGIGEHLVQELAKNLKLRGAETELALVPENSEAGQQLLKKFGYVHDYSEITMAVNAVANESFNKVQITSYNMEESELIEVLVSAFGDTEEEAREMIVFNNETPNRRLMLAIVDKEVVGTVAIVDDSDKLWVTGLAVHKKSRGKGIATSLLNWSKNEAHHLGKTTVYLDVETDNDKALSVYKKAGFKKTNHTDFYRKG